jgi:quercetin 2,3-dioxygenase
MMDMGGMPVRQPFPTHRVELIDPFILLHHADIKVPTDRDPKHTGVGPHPHRGFSPVTFIFRGGVHHQDSRGNNSTIYAGGAQWMNADMGIIHSERPPHDIDEHGGRQEIIQLWINTPAKHKLDQPQYFPLAADEVPTTTSADGLVKVNVFSGNVLNIKGPIPSHTNVNAATLQFKAGGTISIPLPESHNAMMYLLNGELTVDGFGLVDGLNVVHFNNDGEGISAIAKKDTCVLLLSGEPINEKLAKQILQAMRDYQVGKMGVLIEE